MPMLHAFALKNKKIAIRRKKKKRFAHVLSPIPWVSSGVPFVYLDDEPQTFMYVNIMNYLHYINR